MNVWSFHNYMMVHGSLLVLGVIFLVWRKPYRAGFRLKMRSSGFRSGHALFRPRSPMTADSAAVMHSSVGRPQMLNVYFNFNGHSFDAYEVLGVPAGSNWDRVEEAFQAATTSSDESSRQFFQAALQAVEKHLKH